MVNGSLGWVQSRSCHQHSLVHPKCLTGKITLVHLPVMSRVMLCYQTMACYKYFNWSARLSCLRIDCLPHWVWGSYISQARCRLNQIAFRQRSLIVCLLTSHSSLSTIFSSDQSSSADMHLSWQDERQERNYPRPNSRTMRSKQHEARYGSKRYALRWWCFRYLTACAISLSHCLFCFVLLLSKEERRRTDNVSWSFSVAAHFSVGYQQQWRRVSQVTRSLIESNFFSAVHRDLHWTRVSELLIHLD